MTPYKKLFIAGCAMGLMTLASCTDGYESEPVERFTLDYVFSRTDSVGTQARQYLNNMYRHLSSGHNRVGSDYLDAASDDAMSIYFDDCDVYKLVMGRYTASSRVTSNMDWGTYYTTIREGSILVANIDRVPFNKDYTYVKAGEEPDEDGNLARTPFNVTMKAEARFLRAYAYFELVKRYGGVPLMGENVYGLDDNMELPRNSFAECIDYIVSELDAIKDDLRGLPMEGSDATNYPACPTREACVALKARVLLYAASPLFNESPIDPGNPLVGYPQYDVNRWKLAAEAAKELIDDFDNPSGSNGAVRLTDDFRKVFLSRYGNANPENIWYITGTSSDAVEKNNGPLGFTGNAMGQGRTCPTQNLVESFVMKDGKPIGESAYNYSLNDQYSNRDPRLDMTVLHNGSQWLGRRLATYTGGGNNPTSSALYTRTSYYMSKFMGDYTGDSREYTTSNEHPWIVLRYAEVLLNYAEAQNEATAAPDETVYKCIIALRKRAGIEAGDDGLYGLKRNMSQAEMRKVIRNERRSEMAFEEQRYWDIRRWKIAGEVFAKPVRGLTIANRDGVLNFTETNLINVNWDNRRYLYPIPYTEVLKNANMVQNPNW